MKVYINKHVKKQFKQRSQHEFKLDKVSRIHILLQREKNGLEINQLKGCIKLKDVFLVVNIYKHKTENYMCIKGLTVLTQKQLKLSRNFGNGNRLKLYYDVETDEVIFKDKFFNYKEFDDFFKSIKWTDDDVVS